jgi:hypothetical protein
MEISNLHFDNQVDVVPSDSVVFHQPVMIQVLGNAGNVAVITVGGQQRIWSMVTKEIFPIMVKAVLLTGTTATGITMLYN